MIASWRTILIQGFLKRTRSHSTAVADATGSTLEEVALFCDSVDIALARTKKEKLPARMRPEPADVKADEDARAMSARISTRLERKTGNPPMSPGERHTWGKLAYGRRQDGFSWKLIQRTFQAMPKFMGVNLWENHVQDYARRYANAEKLPYPPQFTAETVARLAKEKAERQKAQIMVGGEAYNLRLTGILWREVAAEISKRKGTDWNDSQCGNAAKAYAAVAKKPWPIVLPETPVTAPAPAPVAKEEPTPAEAPEKPEKVVRGDLKAYPNKPPTSELPDWYWRVCYYKGRQKMPAYYEGDPAGRRGTREEIATHLEAMLKAGGWRQDGTPMSERKKASLKGLVVARAAYAKTTAANRILMLEKGEKAYTARLSGKPWTEIAKPFGKNHSTVIKYAGEWAKENGKEWPIKMAAVRSHLPLSVGARCYAIREATGKSWEDIATGLGVRSADRARQNAYRHATENSAAWPVPATPVIVPDAAPVKTPTPQSVKTSPTPKFTARAYKPQKPESAAYIYWLFALDWDWVAHFAGFSSPKIAQSVAERFWRAAKMGTLKPQIRPMQPGEKSYTLAGLIQGEIDWSEVEDILGLGVDAYTSALKYARRTDQPFPWKLKATAVK